MTTALILCLAMLLDAVFGEPRWLWDRMPHPAVLMGRAVTWCDTHFNHGSLRRAKGAAVMGALGVFALATGWILQSLGGLVEVIIVAILLAQKSLVEHVRAVADGLRVSLGDGRRAVAMIVGRDTTDMTEPDVARAAIESAAENLSDGVVAPIFWYLLAGLPGLLLYKITNTADSMIGHRTEKYESFGWAAARFDDLLNLVPARLTAYIIALQSWNLNAWPDIKLDAQQHRSVNAGWPEAAMARSLNVALSGPRSYGGVRRSFPFVHPDGKRDIGASEIEATNRVLWRSWGVTFVFVLALAVVLS